MASVHPHHHYLPDVDAASLLVFGMLGLMFTVIMAMLRGCSAVLANLPHQ